MGDQWPQPFSIRASSHSHQPLHFDTKYGQHSHHIHSYDHTYPHTDRVILKLEDYFIQPDYSKERAEKVKAQNEIDEAVLEALKKPKIEAEVERRIELASVIGSEDKYEPGAVLKWTRKFDKNEYTYAAIKVAGKWYVTGEKQHRDNGWTWDELFTWMLTGESTIENLQVATTWDEIL